MPPVRFQAPSRSNVKKGRKIGRMQFFLKKFTFFLSLYRNSRGQNILMNYQYNYDKMNNILGKATKHCDYTYDYDDIYRLIDADNPTLDHEAFAYDPVGGAWQ